MTERYYPAGVGAVCDRTTHSFAGICALIERTYTRTVGI